MRVNDGRAEAAADRSGVDMSFNRAEIIVATAAFAFALAFFLSRQPRAGATAWVAAMALFVLLVGGYVALSISAVRRVLRSLLRRDPAHVLAGPALLLIAIVLYVVAGGLAVAPRAAAYAAYLLGPTLLLVGNPTPWRQPPIRQLTAAAFLWLPIEFRLLPALPMPAPAGYNAARVVGLVAGLYLFLVARPLPGIGYTYLLRRRDLVAAGKAFLVYAVVALPLGFATGFLLWRPEVSPARVVLAPVLIYLVTAVPEEFLFRGVIQNLLSRWLGARAALALAAVVFGLAHLPDPRYAVLAALAGLAYGWVYLRTGKITASAVTHALVDAVWVLVLGG